MTIPGFSLESENNATVFALQIRRFTAANQKAIGRAMREQLCRSEATIVDISNIDCLDSRTLGAFIEWIKAAGELNRTLIFCGLDRQKRAVLELTRFHEVVDVFNDRNQALAFLSVAALSGNVSAETALQHDSNGAGGLVRVATSAGA